MHSINYIVYTVQHTQYRLNAWFRSICIILVRTLWELRPKIGEFFPTDMCSVQVVVFNVYYGLLQCPIKTVCFKHYGFNYILFESPSIYISDYKKNLFCGICLALKIFIPTNFRNFLKICSKSTPDGLIDGRQSYYYDILILFFVQRKGCSWWLLTPTRTSLEGVLFIRVSLKVPFVMLKLLPPIFLFHLVQSFRFFFFKFFFVLFFYVG